MVVSHDERFDSLDHQTTMIIQRLMYSPSELISSLATQTVEIRRRHDESDKLARQLQQEIFMAINRLQHLLSSLSVATSLSPPPLKPNKQTEILSADEAPTILLNKLKFRQVTTRQENVAVAHPETLRWIINDDQRSDQCKVFSPLRPWLERGEGCHWVNGKAGSGKSMLMKLLSSKRREQSHREMGRLTPAHRRLFLFLARRDHFAEVAGRPPEVAIVHYSVSAARPCLFCQKSLMTSNTALKKIQSPLRSLESIKMAFKFLSRESLGSLKILLFVDGVDEFDGDHAEMSRYFRELATNSVFKIIISSRPILAYVEAFKRCPSLRLQDLTCQVSDKAIVLLL